MTAADVAGDLVSWLLAAAVGYAVGSLQAAASGSDVWRRTGPGFGLLAQVAELATGIVPVALASVTFSWTAGVAAGAGAVIGAAWPALGQRPTWSAGDGVGVLAGVAIALAPPTAVLAAVPGLLAAGVARVAGRRSLEAGVLAWLGAYLVLALASAPGLARGLAVLALCGVTVASRGRTRRGRVVGGR